MRLLVNAFKFCYIVIFKKVLIINPLMRFETKKILPREKENVIKKMYDFCSIEVIPSAKKPIRKLTK